MGYRYALVIGISIISNAQWSYQVCSIFYVVMNNNTEQWDAMSKN